MNQVAERMKNPYFRKRSQVFSGALSWWPLKMSNRLTRMAPGLRRVPITFTDRAFL